MKMFQKNKWHNVSMSLHLEVCKVHISENTDRLRNFLLCNDAVGGEAEFDNTSFVQNSSLGTSFVSAHKFILSAQKLL